MAAPADHRQRPSLTPIWTPYYTLGAFPRSPLRSARSYVFSPSPRSPKSIPTPVYPSGSHEGAARQHERAMVERLDVKAHLGKGSDTSPPGSASSSRPLSPITEGPPSARRYSATSATAGSLQGNLPRHSQLLPTPVSPADTFPRRQTLVAETRSMLLVGIPDEPDRRLSAPLSGRPIESRKVHQMTHLEQLRAWGHVYYRDATTADVFVQAVAFKRPSEASSATPVSASASASASASTSTSLTGTPNADEPKAKDTGDTKDTKDTKANLLQPRHTTLRARVRPRDLDRKPFLITREFDLAELRATIPDPLPEVNVSPATPPSRRSSAIRFPSRAGTPLSPVRAAHARRRSSSARHGLLPSGHGLRSGGIQRSQAVSRGTSAIPIHFEYARAQLPVLAALMVSGHVREGDIIDLPLPHPEAWPATVAYVYTCQGDLTTAIRENMLHLAGKA